MPIQLVGLSGLHAIVEPECCDRDLPFDRHGPARDRNAGLRRHHDLGTGERPCCAVGRDPVAEDVIVAVGLPHPVQHQLLAGCKMEREPVPSGLVGGERLAAPFTIHPGLTGDLRRLVVDNDAACHREERLAVVIGGLVAALRFAAEAGIALQHQRPVGVKLERVAEIGAAGVDLERRQRLLACRGRAAHLPGIDPGRKRPGLDAGLSDPAAGEGLGEAMAVGTGDRGMPHPELLAGPPLALWSRPRGLSKQRPLDAACGAGGVDEVRRHIPPFDAKIGMRAMVGGKRKQLARCDLGIAFRILPEPGIALRDRRPPRQAETARPPARPAAKARRDNGRLAFTRENPHQIGRLHPCQPQHRQQRLRAARPPWQRRAIRRVAAGRHGTAAASRMPSH